MIKDENAEKIRRLKNVRRHLIRRHGPEARPVIVELDKLIAWRKSLKILEVPE